MTLYEIAIERTVNGAEMQKNCRETILLAYSALLFALLRSAKYCFLCIIFYFSVINEQPTTLVSVGMVPVHRWHKLSSIIVQCGFADRLLKIVLAMNLTIVHLGIVVYNHNNYVTFASHPISSTNPPSQFASIPPSLTRRAAVFVDEVLRNRYLQIWQYGNRISCLE